MRYALVIILSVLFVANPLVAHDDVNHSGHAKHTVVAGVDGSMPPACQANCDDESLRGCCAKTAIHCASAFSVPLTTSTAAPVGSKNLFGPLENRTLLGLVFEAETPPPRI